MGEEGDESSLFNALVEAAAAGSPLHHIDLSGMYVLYSVCIVYVLYGMCTYSM